jgi:hypothetical protein
MSRVSNSLREHVRKRAQGRCEYCHKPEGIKGFRHQIDHIIPERHLGKTELNNLALACFRCNNAKGMVVASYDPETGELAPFYNPRTQNWDEHFKMDTDALIQGRTPIGRVTINILQMNRPRQLEFRRLLIELGEW